MDVWGVCPDVLPPSNLDRSGRAVWLALKGYPQLAADTILSTEVRGRLEPVVGGIVRQLNLTFVQTKSSRKECYETLIEIALSLIGLERKRAGFSEKESQAVLKEIIEALKEWEATERKEGSAPAASEVVNSLTSSMKKVLFGQGMVAKMGEAIESSLDRTKLAESFILASKAEIQGNVYYQIVDAELSKLGNDSATGLRWLRHLGAVQVSSNPVIAARAYEELPDLWKKFRSVLDIHPEWRENPEKFADEMTTFATIVALLPNLLDFRPIALLSDFREGMVSIQLNPYKSGSRRESLEDAQRIYTILQEILMQYDAHLMGSADFEGRGRPNVVFKVASGTPAAIEITQALDRIGIGTNNTVTYTVTQGITVAMAAMRGLASALRMGIPVTRVYITNMEGRLEDHLREAQAARLLRGVLSGERIQSTAEKLGVGDDVRRAATEDEKLAILCARKNLKTLTEDWFASLIPKKTNLPQMEKDIRWAGILVTRRVYGMAFGPKAALKWAKHLQKTFGLSAEKAREVVSMVDLLPASKRREEDTYQVLGRHATNLTNTEFPDQQLKVWMHSRKKGFKLSDYVNTISAKPEAGVLARLLKMEDFRRAYELSSGLSKELNRIGMVVPLEKGGIEPEKWESYGPVAKTMKEFKGAYVGFLNKLVSTVQQPQTPSDAPSK